MATRRKYKTREDAAPVDVDSLAAAAPPVAAVVPSSVVADDNPLQKAAQAHGRAEELQRQSAQQRAVPTNNHQQQVAAHIDGLPISEFKKDFLRRHPELLFEPLNHLMRHHYQLALHAGVDDDSPAMNQAILDGLQRDLDQGHQQSLA